MPMPFWAKLFGSRRRSRLDQYLEERRQERERSRALLLNETGKEIIHASLKRLEAAGLRIQPNLNRDLIVVRCLRDFAERYGFDELSASFPPKNGEEPQISVDLMALWALTSEVNVYSDIQDFSTIVSKLSSLSKDALESVLDAHSSTIFENASVICIVNEHEAEDYLRQHVEELCSLTCGDIKIRSLKATQRADRLIGIVTLTDGRHIELNFSAEKRPDLTPFFKSMNALVKPSGVGRFLVVPTGSSEDLVALYLRPSEQIAFREWAERQHCAGNPAPIDWLD